MPFLGPRRNELRENINFIVKVILPVILVIAITPYIVNPSNMESFKRNFNIILVLKSLCEDQLELCGLPLDQDINDSFILKSDLKDFIYVRPFFFDSIDKFFVKYFGRFWLKKILVDTSDENFEESAYLLIGFFNFSVFSSIRSLIIARLQFYFLIQILVHFGDKWALLIENIWNDLKSSVDVF